MKRKMFAGMTSVTLGVFVQDTSSTTGAGLAITHASSGLVFEYRRQGQSSWTSVTPVSGTLGTYTSGGIVADGSLTGAIEIGVPDAALASGARFCLIRLRGVSNMLPVLVEIELDAVDYQNATSFGLSRLDAAVSSRMATYTQPTGFLAATFPTTVASTTNITSASGVTLAATTHTGAVIPTVSTVTNGVTVSTNNDKTGYALSSTGLSLVTAWTVNVTGNITGNLSGSVGSVTGAVGSVTSGVTVSSIGANVITATSIAANALDGKGNWNVGKTGYSLTQAFPTNFAALGITVGGNIVGVVGVQNIDDGAIGTGTLDGPVYDTIRDSVWNATLSSYSTAGTAGKALSDLVTRITSTLFNGITSLRSWLGALAGKTADTTTRAEINATTAGATYNETTDSQEAIRDRGDAAWTTGSGGGGGGGDPWATDLVAGSYTDDQAGAVMLEIKAKTDLITTDGIVTSNPVATTGQITGPLYIGDDYLSANGRAFAWTFTPATGVSFSGATCRFGGGYLDSGWLVTGTLTNNGSTWTASFDLTKTETDALEPGFYDWTMEVRSSTGTEITTVAARKPVEWKAKRT